MSETPTPKADISENDAFSFELARLVLARALSSARQRGIDRFLGDVHPGPVAKVVLDHPTREVHYDYSVPPELSPLVKVGSVVSVPSRNRRSKGWVVGFSTEVAQKLKDIHSVLAPFPLLSLAQVQLAAAAAEYYLTDVRRFLRRMMPPSLPRTNECPPDRARAEFVVPPLDIASWLVDALEEEGYDSAHISIPSCSDVDEPSGTVVVVRHPPGYPPTRALSTTITRLRSHNLSSLIALGSSLSKDARRILHALRDDLYFLDTKASAGSRRQWWAAALRPGALLAGDRGVVLQRTTNLGMTCVIDESSPSHIEDRIPYYNARTVALLRSRIERCCVLLSAPWPTYDARAAASVLVSPPRNKWHSRLFTLKVVDRSSEVPEPGYISPTSARLVRRVLETGGRAVLFVSKKGEYRSLRCKDCWFVTEKGSTQRCPRCRSHRLKPASPGASAIEAEARRLFSDASVGVLVKDSPRIDEGVSVIVATEAALWRIDRVDLVVVVSFESLVGLVSFDAWFRTTRIVYDLCALVARSPEQRVTTGDEQRGMVAIQTYHPSHPVLAALLADEERIVLEADLGGRRAEGLPPYSRAVLLETSDREGRTLLDAFCEKITSAPEYEGEVQVAGPHDDGDQRRALILHNGSASFWEPVVSLRRAAESKGARVKIKVDPDASYLQL